MNLFALITFIKIYLLNLVHIIKLYRLEDFLTFLFLRTTIHIITFYLKIDRVKLIVMDLISGHHCSQAFGLGEYFHVLVAISHSHCGISNPQVPIIMIIAFILPCPEIKTVRDSCFVIKP